MSETGNPLIYIALNDNIVAITEKGEGLTRQQITGPTALTFLLEREFDKAAYVHLDGKLVRVSSIPLASEAFATESCIAEQLQAGRWGGDWSMDTSFLPKCDRPVRALQNGWSAGPTPLCQWHLAFVHRQMESSGLWWRPVRVTTEHLDQLIANEELWSSFVPEASGS